MMDYFFGVLGGLVVMLMLFPAHFGQLAAKFVKGYQRERHGYNDKKKNDD